MKQNVTISLEAKVLADARAYAARQGKSFQELAREAIERTIRRKDEPEDEWEFFKIVDRLKPNSGGWKWSREEIYEHIYKGLS